MHNPKESWQTINRILGRSQNKSNTITSLKTGENVISDPNNKGDFCLIGRLY